MLISEVSISEGKVIFLFGAGVSLPAGLPGIARMTSDFFGSHLSSDHHLNPIRDRILRLWDITKQDFGPSADLESFMTMLMELQNERYRKKIINQYTDLADIQSEELTVMRLGAQNFIRNKLETINFESVEYLAPILGFLKQDLTLSIFSLNYDGVVEVLAEGHNQKYSDGFDPFWNIHAFEDPGVRIRIYKIHGSLYWFRSQSGKSMKIPIKGADVGVIRYMSDDALSEMIIYPTLQKDKSFHIYTWLLNKFISELNEARFCIIIGYSLRDDDIRDNITNALQSNKNLWLIIVNPSASRYKVDHFENLDDVSSRVVTLDKPVEAAVSGRLLHKQVEKLTNARNEEEEHWKRQFTETEEIGTWEQVIFSYKEIHEDRIKNIAENLLQYNFSPRRPTLPMHAGEKSLYYVSDYISKGNLEKSLRWCKLLIEFCIVSEYAFFSNSNALKDSNPIKREDLEQHLRGPAETKDHFSWTEIISSARKSLDLLQEDDTIKRCIRKMLESIEALEFATDEYGRIREERTDQLIIKYENDLGLKKWSEELRHQLLLRVSGKH